MNWKKLALAGCGAFALGALVVGAVWLWGAQQAKNKPKKVVSGVGFVRGFGMVSLRNKYAGFVTKINFYTGDRVKKGDVILEYDDYEWRVKLQAARDAVVDQEEVVALKKFNLQLTTIDPTPSEYRNLANKYHAAQTRAARLRHEQQVYEKLHEKQIISDLSYREKTQETKDAEYTELNYAQDIERLEAGMAPLYINIQQQELTAAERHLEVLRRQLALVEEDGKYYKIVAPYDGIVEVCSDTLNDYDSAGTVAAEVHDHTRGTKVYCYFDERDVQYVKVGEVYRFRTNCFDCEKKGFPQVRPFRVKKTHSSYGDRSLYLVQCVLVSTPEPLPCNAMGQLEIDVE